MCASKRHSRPGWPILHAKPSFHSLVYGSESLVNLQPVVFGEVIWRGKKVCSNLDLFFIHFFSFSKRSHYSPETTLSVKAKKTRKNYAATNHVTSETNSNQQWDVSTPGFIWVWEFLPRGLLAIQFPMDELLFLSLLPSGTYFIDGYAQSKKALYLSENIKHAFQAYSYWQ